MLRWAARKECHFTKYLSEPESEQKWDGQVDGVEGGNDSESEASNEGGNEGGDDDDDEELEEENEEEKEEEKEEVDEEERDGHEDDNGEEEIHSAVQGPGERDRRGRSAGRARRAVAPKALNTDGFWNTERLERVMKRELTNVEAGFVVTPSSWRQLYPAIQRVHSPEEARRSS